MCTYFPKLYSEYQRLRKRRFYLLSLGQKSGKCDITPIFTTAHYYRYKFKCIHTVHIRCTNSIIMASAKYSVIKILEKNHNDEHYHYVVDRLIVMWQVKVLLIYVTMHITLRSNVGKDHFTLPGSSTLQSGQVFHPG